jgi:transposase InsO family protein
MRSWWSAATLGNPLRQRARTDQPAFSGVGRGAADRVDHIQPGKPTQNAHAESFHGRLREECLAVSWFQRLFDAWRIEYNEERPHSSLGYRTPKEFAARASTELNSAHGGYKPSRELISPDAFR